MNITGIYHETALGGFFLGHMFPIMGIIFLAFLTMLIINLRRVSNPFSGLSRRELLMLSAIFSLGFVFMNSQYTYGYRFDGIFYVESADAWLETGTFVKGCAFGSPENCSLYHQVLFPAGFPFIIAVIYSALGPNTLLPMALNGLFGSLSILLTFIISRKLFGDTKAALFSALAFSLIPLNIAISGTAAVRPISQLFLGLTALLFLTATEKGRTLDWALFFMSLSLSIYMRQENSIIMVPLTFLYIITKKDPKQALLSGRFLVPAAIFLASQIPVQHYVLFMGGLAPGIPAFSFSYLPQHLPLMLQSLFLPVMGTLLFPAISSVLLFSSILLIFKPIQNHRACIAFLWIWFVSFFLLYALYFQCQRIVCGDFFRYLSSVCMPYALLAGLSLSSLSSKIRVRTEVMLTALAAMLIITSGLSLPAALFRDSRLDEPVLGDHIRALSRLPDGSTVITGIYPSIFLKNAGVDGSVIDLDMIMPQNSYFNALALAEMKKSRSLYLMVNDDANGTPFQNNIDQAAEWVDLKPAFKEGTMLVYMAELRDEWK